MAGVSLDNSGATLTINLYPMLDIFSILICFLLMNFSTQGESAESMPNLELPISEVKMSLDEAATVSITQKDIVIQGGVTVPIGPEGDVADDQKTQGALKVAYTEFKRLKESQETLKNRDQNLQLSKTDLNTLSMEADKQTKFLLLKRVMLSAQQAEFISWKLAASKSDVN